MVSYTYGMRLLIWTGLFLMTIYTANGRRYMKFKRRFVCHQGFIVKGVCFQLHQSPASYDEAEAICQSRNGTLAQYAAHGVHKRLAHLGVNNIRVGMKYNKDCEPFSDETGSHEPIESNWFRKVSQCDKQKLGDCMLLVRNDSQRKHRRTEKRAIYVNDKCSEKRGFMCKIYITANWKLVRSWNTVMEKNTVRSKVKKITPSTINEELGIDLPEGDLKLPTSNREKRTINPYNMSPFRNGIICYKIEDDYTEEKKQFIKDQMTKISTKCCVKFLELNSDNKPKCDNHYVRIFNGRGCWSYVGKTRGNTDEDGLTYQDLSLYHTDRATCLIPEVTQHELLHAVGFWHEHSRADRIYYLKIYTENAKDGKQHNFHVKNHDVYMAMGSFDIMSTMMYSRDEFLNTTRGAYTVLDRLSPFNIDDNDYFGSNEFSDEDMNKCNRIYHQMCKARDGTEMPYYDILTPWTTWTSCSKVCGGGIRKRTRYCTSPGGCQNVHSEKEQQETCNTQPCPERYSYRHLGTFKASRAPQGWLEVDISKYQNKGWDDIRVCAEAAKENGFTEFGLVEGTCLHGVDYLENGPFLFSTKDGRGNYALGLFDAVDVYTLSQNADSLMKGYWTAWSGWSSCSYSCGKNGIQIRSREWLTPNGVDIPYEKNLKSETRSCNRFNCDFQCGNIQCLYGDCVDGKCNCWPGYLGQKCTRDVNVCECCSEGTFTGICENVSPDACCDVNAHCIDKFGTFLAECMCKDGYFGDGHRCQKNPCDDDPCEDNEVCTIGGDLNPVCNCQHGYKRHEKTSRCVAINECNGDNKCSASQLSECKNLKGTYMCICIEGTVGDGIQCSDVDECALGTHNCPPETTCENMSPSYTCKCKSGYKLINSTCTDINECATHISNCDVNADCYNTDGSHTCTCKGGYQGNGHTCTDIDECVKGTHGCSSDATCSNTGGSYKCTCKTGYKGNGTTCTDIDECMSGIAECSDNADCTNTAGSHTCTCRSGYTGDGKICQDIDECDAKSDNCPIDADCFNTEGSYKCVCKLGYEGDGRSCTDINECTTDTHTCDLNARCTNTKGSYNCTCKPGYEGDGRKCSNTNECANGVSDCDPNANCIDTVDSYKCHCKTGYKGDGKTCTDIDECTTGGDKCDPNAACTNTKGSYNCTCKHGYEGDGMSCSNINECTTGASDCDPNADCKDKVGSYECHCKTGYKGDGKTCTDVDECTTGGDNCDPNAACTNTKGSYSCTCKPGYEGNGRSCSNINECTTGASDCDPNADCKDKVGSYECHCKTGYKGDGKTCTDINECVTDVCDSNAQCINTEGSYGCTCKSGYEGNGLTCSRIDPCTTGDNKCNKNADCTPVGDSYTCSCKPGYKGDGVTCTKCANSDCSDTCLMADKVVNLATEGQAVHHGHVRVGDYGVNGRLANLTDETSYIELDGSCLNNPESCSDGLTVSLWFRQTTAQRNENIFEMPEVIMTSGPEPVPGVTDGDGLGVTIYRKVKGSHSLMVLLRVENRDYICDIASSMFENDKWNQIALTWNNKDGLKIYFNGHLRDVDATGQSPASPSNIYDSLNFGHALQYQDYNYFLGSYGEFRMSENVLTDDEIYENYKCNIQNVCELDLCHAQATCAEGGCLCKTGFTGDGFTCSVLKEPDSSLKLPEVSLYWKMTSFNNQDVVPTKGDVTLLHDNRLKPVMKLVDGVYKYDRSIMCDGRHDAFRSDIDFSGLCHGVPDKCEQGFAITFWIRFDGRDLFGSFMRPNFILSTGGHAGSNTTGVTLWVLGSQLHVDVQTIDTRYQTATSIYPLGLWKHIGVILRQHTRRRPGSLSVYINGQRVATATGKSHPTEAVGNHYLTLCRPNNCQTFMGRFDMNRLALWNTPLQAEHILDIHDHGVLGDGE